MYSRGFEPVSYTQLAEDTRVRQSYVSLKKFISINILGEDLLERSTYHSVAHMKFEDIEENKYVDMGDVYKRQYLYNTRK